MCSRAAPYGGGWIELIPRQPRRVRAIRMAFAVIGLNILTQIISAVIVATGSIEVDRAITFSVWVGLAFYGVVMVMVADALDVLRPRWLAGVRQTAPLLGIEVGLAAAAVLITLLWLVTGEPVIDPNARALVSEGTALRTIMAFVLIAGAAPVVEEMLFRGVVAESLRKYGAPVAIGVSSLLFALAHLRSLPYYTLMGAGFGLLYWRRGLWASIAAHAAFNGALVLLAVVVAVGPTRTFVGDGISVRAPASWKAPDGGAAPSNAVFALEGPSGASLVAVRQPLPEVVPTLEQVAAAFNSGAVPTPEGWEVKVNSARVVSYGELEAVEVRVKVEGHAGLIVLIPHRGVVWEIDIATAGSARAEREIPDILQSLTFAGARA